MTRMGVTFAEFTGRTTETLAVPGPETRTDFYFKALPAPDGKGLDTDPSLVYCTREETVRWVKGVRRRTGADATPGSIRWPTCPCGHWSR